jgi:hypothetical protein
MFSVRIFEQYGLGNDKWLDEKYCAGMGNKNKRKNTNIEFIHI